DRIALLERRQVFERSRAVRSRIEVDSPHLPGEPKGVVSDQVWRRGVERLEKVGVTHHEQLGTLNSPAELCHAPGFEQRNIGPQNRLRRAFQGPDEGAHLRSVAVLESLYEAAPGQLNRGERSRRRIRAGGLRHGGPRAPVTTTGAVSKCLNAQPGPLPLSSTLILVQCLPPEPSGFGRYLAVPMAVKKQSGPNEPVAAAM